jgi:hypothetical protein
MGGVRILDFVNIELLLDDGIVMERPRAENDGIDNENMKG